MYYHRAYGGKWESVEQLLKALPWKPKSALANLLDGKEYWYQH